MSRERTMSTRRRTASRPTTHLQEACDLFIALLLNCGFAPAEVRAVTSRALQQTRAQRRARGALDLRYQSQASHVITHWYQDPGLLQANGAPAPLPLFGAGASVAALVRKVNSELDPKIMVAYLLHVKGLRKSSRGWVPRHRYLSFVGDPLSQNRHAFEGLLGLLRNCHHNATRKPTEGTWPEARMLSGEIPERFRARADRLTRRLGNDFLYALDRELQVAEIRRPRRRGRSMRVGVGMYYYELPP